MNENIQPQYNKICLWISHIRSSEFFTAGEDPWVKQGWKQTKLCTPIRKHLQYHTCSHLSQPASEYLTKETLIVRQIEFKIDPIF